VTFTYPSNQSPKRKPDGVTLIANTSRSLGSRKNPQKKKTRLRSTGWRTSFESYGPAHHGRENLQPIGRGRVRSYSAQPRPRPLPTKSGRSSQWKSGAAFERHGCPPSAHGWHAAILVALWRTAESTERLIPDFSFNQ